MDLQETLREAIIEELRRQAENSEGALALEDGNEADVIIRGPVNLDDLVMVIAGSVAGGP